VFNWVEFTFGKDVLEPAIEALMTGDTPIVAGGLAIGVNGAGALECDEEPPAVAFEFWAKHYFGSALDATYKYVHWVFPRTTWQWGDNTQEGGAIGRTVLSGTSATNELWGGGPYGDGPPDGQDVVEWARFFTNDIPEATECGVLGTGAIGS
jgi:hypothetical protein